MWLNYKEVYSETTPRGGGIMGIYDSVWGYDHALDGKNMTSFIRKLSKN